MNFQIVIQDRNFFIQGWNVIYIYFIYPQSKIVHIIQVTTTQKCPLNGSIEWGKMDRKLSKLNYNVPNS